MPLVTSLLAAVVRADGDALVLHTGERPYVVAPSGQSEISSRALTLEAMTGMIAELLPQEARQALDDLGAVQHDLPSPGIFANERFTVVAARGGNDIWIEIRRYRSTQTAEEVEKEPESRSAVVLPLSRSHVRGEQSVRPTQALQTAGLDRLLRIAAARGASTLYLSSHSRPLIRIDGEISAIDGEAVLSEPHIEALMLDIIPERNRDALRSQAGTEWFCDVPDVGRIRCVTFRDHRGAGGIFRMIPARAISAEQLGLSKEIQALCAEPEGLVLVTGPRASGKSTLISAFVDLINRTRSDHVITLESQIKFVHENRGSLVSQREVRGDRDELLSVARSALRENPDVLVIEDFGSPEIVTLALEAAQSGHLVLGALTGHSATDVLDRILDQTPPEHRPKVQLGLAENLRGVIAQVLLRKCGGGRVAAREVLLNTGAVANLIAEGKTSQLAMAIDSGRRHGMVALNDAFVAFVKGGIVDSREAYRHAADQPGFLALLKQQGIDTSFVERLA
jgi:twitching motility protein PilT